MFATMSFTRRACSQISTAASRHRSSSHASLWQLCLDSPACAVQGKWLYLEPIFGSDEIIRQIPTEGAAFRDMDAIWRSIMAAVKEQPLILQASHALRLLQMQPPAGSPPFLAMAVACACQCLGALDGPHSLSVELLCLSTPSHCACQV